VGILKSPHETAREQLRYSSGGGRWVIAATVLGSGVAALGSTVVGIALPSIGREFKVGVAYLQWVSSGICSPLPPCSCWVAPWATASVEREFSWWASSGSGSPRCFVRRAHHSGHDPESKPGGGRSGPAHSWESGHSAGLFRPRRPLPCHRCLVGAGRRRHRGGSFHLIPAVSWRLIFLINVPLVLTVVLISLRHVPETRDKDARGV
jgi:hypothetical protein